MSLSAMTAKNANMISCHTCHLLCRKPSDLGRIFCPRCRTRLRQRKTDSISRTWALVVAAFICYIPANMLSITHTTSLGKTQSDTIISGVIHFIATGSWGIAIVIFVASVFVPFAKLLILTFLLVSVQSRWRLRPKDRTRLYRITEMIGRWSMVDIYAITILVSLVNLGALAGIKAGGGAVFFGAVVVITMFAAMTFDPRLIWDVLEENNE